METGSYVGEGGFLDLNAYCIRLLPSCIEIHLIRACSYAKLPLLIS